MTAGTALGRARLADAARRAGLVPDRIRPLGELYPGVPMSRHVPATTVPTPELVHLPLAAAAAHLRAPVYTTPEVVSAVLDGAGWWSGREVVVTRSRRFVVAESIPTERRRRVRGAFRAPPGRRIHGTATVLRAMRAGYYHTLVDNVPRLLALHDPPYCDLPSVEVLCGGPPTPVERRLLEAVLPPNAGVRVAERGRVHPVEHLVVVTPLTRRFAGYLPERWRRLVADRLLPRRPRARNQRIFVSRRPGGTRRRAVLNETEIKPVLKAAGFHRWFLEELTLDEQVELFYDAEAVVAPHGAGLANLVFAEGVDVLELFPSPDVYPHYWFLARSCGHRWDHLCSAEPTKAADFSVDPVAVAAWVDTLDP